MRGPVPPSDAAGRGGRTGAGLSRLIGRVRDALRPARPWLGHAVGARIEPTADPVYDRRIVLDEPAAGRWLVLTYSAQTAARPLLRLERSGGPPQELPLPGVTGERAFWLGLMPRDLAGIGLSVGPEPGFRIERAGLRGHASLLLECLLKRPLRAPPALYEFARGDERRFRDILRGACAVVPMARHDAFSRARSVAEGAAALTRMPVRLVMIVRDGEGGIAATVRDLLAQTHRDWSLVVAGERAPSSHGDSRIAGRSWDEAGRWGDLMGEGAAFGLLDPGDRLAPDALARLAAALSPPAGPSPDLAYADHLSEAEGRTSPVLKPGWSPDLALASGYHGAAALVAPHLAASLAALPLGPSRDAATAWEIAVAAAAASAVHVPRPLATLAGRPADPGRRARLLADRLRGIGSPAEPRIRDGVLDLHWPLPEPAPLVSIVIPSRDRLDLIERVTRGVLSETAYSAIEMVIVDNGSTDPGVLAHYETLKRDPRVAVLPFPAPFNFSAMVNAGVAASSGSVVVLLNNDVAVLEPDWLDAMVRQALRPEVGAVGAKLLYGDGTLQHAGVVVGLGGRAGHILRRRPADTPGRLGRLRVAHEVSAVTAACLAVSRTKYDAVGGFDAEAFPVDFNDVDFCLRLGAAGWKTVWTPLATLAHLESVSRGPSVGEKRARFEREAATFVGRWREAIRHDPFYHPALSLTTFGEDLE